MNEIFKYDRIDKLRALLQEAIWTGTIDKLDTELMSLNDIISKGRCPNKTIEQYVMIPKLYSAANQEQTDNLFLIVSRIDINFNGTKCKLFQFTDITIY